jgi:hypothetical protein
MVRRAVFQSLQGFRTDLRYGEDLELWARIASRHGVVCLPDALGKRRSHDTNTTKSLDPMLRDLVRMSEIIRAWGSMTLRAQGLDPDRLVADAKTDLGYWLFTQDRLDEARTVLWASVRERVSWRALRLLGLSCLPVAVARGLRCIRRRVGAGHA